MFPSCSPSAGYFDALNHISPKFADHPIRPWLTTTTFTSDVVASLFNVVFAYPIQVLSLPRNDMVTFPKSTLPGPFTISKNQPELVNVL